MTSFEDRLAVGIEHEQRVAEELTLRGWAVSPWGQGVLDEGTRAALQATESALRWTPDLVAARGEVVVLVDAKCSLSPHTGRHSVARDAVRAHLQSATLYDVPVYYVFSDLGVMTPHEVLAVGRTGPHLTIGRRGPYYLIPGGLCRPFDDVFGSAEQVVAQWSRTLRAA